MKRILIFCYLILLLSYSLPFLGTLYQRSLSPQENTGQTVSVLVDGGETELDMTEYLMGVVAAEMPASFEPEALKAQAIAARSYAMYCAESGKHKNGLVCTSSECCQAYLNDSELRRRWGADYEKYRRKVLAAVTETEGEYLSFMGQPAQAVFHSSSVFATESSENLWGYVPYLVSVSSPENAENVPGLTSFVPISAEELKNTVLSFCPETVFPEDCSQWLGDIRRDSSGRVESVRLGSSVFSGREMRKMFLLRSTAFELTYGGGAFLFTVYGFGHGVGMSQYGANVMAQNGADHASILTHYYPGTSLAHCGEC